MAVLMWASTSALARCSKTALPSSIVATGNSCSQNEALGGQIFATQTRLRRYLIL